MVDQVDVVVAGAGVAGLSAAVFAGRYGHRTLVLTGETLGGHLISVGSVEDFVGFPSTVPGYEVIPAIQEQATAAGAAFRLAGVTRLEPADGGWHIETDGDVVQARSVILATGSQPRRLGVPGEAELGGKGVAECASCDGPMYRGRTVAVVGGGDSAMQESLELSQHVEKVVLLVDGDALRGQQAYARRVLDDPAIEVRYHTAVTEIVGQDRVEALRTRNTLDGAESTIEIAGVFVNVGLEPRTGWLDGLVDLDGEGRVPTDSGLRTRVPGLLAAGDVRSGAAGQAATAAGDGVAAAVSADKYLRDTAWPETFQPWRLAVG